MKSKRERFIRGYRANMDAAIAQLDLAHTYAEDGAGLDASRCAEMAIKFLGNAHKLKTSAFALPSKATKEAKN